MQTTLTSSSDEKYTRCPLCGLRLPEWKLPSHLTQKHGMDYSGGLPGIVVFENFKEESGENGTTN